MYYTKRSILIIMFMAVTISSCLPPPEGNPETGYVVWGYVGQSSTEVAPGASVMLLDGNTDRPLASERTNFLGKYVFKGLQPGYYKIKVSDKIMEIVVSDKNQRVDLDLSSKDGSMNYAAGALKNATAPGKPGGDPGLAQRFAGKWYSYSGSSGGGSESQMAFCPNGSYYENYEAGYYGSSQDQYGNQDMSYGSASQSGASGSWSIEGTVTQGRITINYSNGGQTVIEYSQGDDPQCYYFDGRLHCYNGACD